MRGRGQATPRSFSKRQIRRPHRFRDSPPEETLPLSPDEEVVLNFQNKIPSTENVNGTSPNIQNEENVNVEQESANNSPQQNENLINAETNPDVSAPDEDQIPDQQNDNRPDNASPNVDANDNDAELSDVEDEAKEYSIGERIHHQCERLYDLLEDIERVNKSGWTDSKFRHEAMDKLQMMIEKVNRVRQNSLDLPEFLERRPMGNQPGYEYIPRIQHAWNLAKLHIAKAKEIVHKLPAVNPRFEANHPAGDTTGKKNNSRPATSSSSRSSILAEDIENFRKRGQEFDKKMRNFANQRTDNVQQMYGPDRGQALNDLLNNRIPPQNQPMPPRNKAKRPNVRILPRGVAEEVFLNKRPQRPAPKLWQEDDDMSEFNDAASVQSAVSLPLRNPNPPRPKNPSYKNYDFGFRSKNRNPLPPPEDDWVVIRTRKNPQAEKPRHYGRIVSFKNLFMNSFQLHRVFNPNNTACTHGSTNKNVKITPFDGENIEFFREFEQGLLLKAINNTSDDFDAKFYTLLDCTSGIALNTVQAYTDELTIDNFVQAIEDLYYNYGRPNKYRNALTYQLLNDEFIDISKPKSLQKVNALITKILRAFKTDISGISGEAYLSQTFISESVKMTKESKQSYKTFLMAKDKENNLRSLTDWITYTYQDLVSESSKPRYFKGLKSSQPPVLMGTPSQNENDDSSDCSESNEVVAFTKPNNAMARKDSEQPNSNFRVTNIKSNYPGDVERCDLCFDAKHKYANCRVFVFLTPDQRKLWLLTRNGCYTCTAIGHSSSKCASQRKCLTCQSTKHHELICDAATNSWEATKSKKWNKDAPKVKTDEVTRQDEKQDEPTKSVHFLEGEESQ